MALFKLFGGAVYAAAELLFGQFGKPSFHQVEPTCRSGSKVQLEARPFRQPVADRLCFMSSAVIQNQVDIQVGRNAFLDGVEEGAKLDRAMAALCLSDQFPRTWHRVRRTTDRERA